MATMARLVKAACPNCGAGVQLDVRQDWVTCTYCGTSSFIQRPTPKRAPQPAPPAHYPVIQLPPASAFRALLFVPIIAMVVLAFAGAAVALFTTWTSSSVGGVLPVKVAQKPIIIGAPMLADIDGNGVDDIVVMTQTTAGETVRHLSGIRSDTGEFAWTTKKLASSSDASQPVCAIADNRVLVARLATLEAFDIRSGQAVWQVSLPERVEMYCRLPDGRPAAATKDNRLFSIELAGGSLTESGRVERHPQLRDPRLSRLTKRTVKKGDIAAAPCVPLASDVHHARGRGVIELTAILTRSVEGMSTRKALTLEHRPPYLLLGSRSSGTRIPMVAAYSGETVLWKQEVPAADPVRAKEGDPLAATVAVGSALVAYEMQEPKQARMTSFDLATGKRHWDVALPVTQTSFARLVASDHHAVFGAHWSLHVVALADGKLTRSIP